MPTNPNVTPAMKPMVQTPQIPDLKQHIQNKLKEIVHMDASESQAYDTSFTWAFVAAFH